MSEIFFFIVLIFISSCGIKGKPLPPVEATAQQLTEPSVVKEKKK